MMKKKNVLLVSLAFALVAVIAIGATFALLSDSTGPVTNTFTVAENGIQIELREPQFDGVDFGGGKLDPQPAQLGQKAEVEAVGNIQTQAVDVVVPHPAAHNVKQVVFHRRVLQIQLDQLVAALPRFIPEAVVVVGVAVKELELQRVIHYILYYLLLKIASVVENFYFSLLRGKIFNNSGV